MVDGGGYDECRYVTASLQPVYAIGHEKHWGCDFINLQVVHSMILLYLCMLANS